MKKKRTYFFKLFGKTHSGVMHTEIKVWDEEGELSIVVLKQLRRYSPIMEILYYTINGSNWLALENGKRTENGKEINDFYYY